MLYFNIYDIQPTCWFCNNTLSRISNGINLNNTGPNYYFCDKHPLFTVRYETIMLKDNFGFLNQLILARHNMKMYTLLADTIDRNFHYPNVPPVHINREQGLTRISIFSKADVINVQLSHYWPLDKTDEQIANKMDQITKLKIFL